MSKAGGQLSLFILCESCHWCATYLDKTKAKDRCITCTNANISSFPIMPDESFTFSYDEKRGVEMDFGRRKKR